MQCKIVCMFFICKQLRFEDIDALHRYLGKLLRIHSFQYDSTLRTSPVKRALGMDRFPH